ncbi:MAG: DEAD/DEAH box helicase [Alicyclobacillus sp.]|nr:DEAD/DEAH box helicase [Alicyclobacillus sp.]
MPDVFVQADGTIVIPSTAPGADAVRAQITPFAELSRQLADLQVYRVTPLSLWQAAAVGWTPRSVLTTLRALATAPLPFTFQQSVQETMSRWGRIRLRPAGEDGFELVAPDLDPDEIIGRANLRELAVHPGGFPAHTRAEVKRRLAEAGYPCLDDLGYRASPPLAVQLRQDVQLRPYQREAVQRFLASHDQSGVVVLPCGAGKTLVGIACLCALQTHTLVVTPTESSARQWIREMMRFTTLDRADVGLYRGSAGMKPITVTTYQQLTAKTRAGRLVHLERILQAPFGFVVYDEVHMVPAPLFRLAASMQAVRRLGLTATLVREDGAETDVFTLIGPKCYEAAWRQLELDGFLARVRCVQVRVPMTPEAVVQYRTSGTRQRHRVAAQNAAKVDAAVHLVAQHRDEPTLVIGHYLDGLRATADRLGCPLVTGQTPPSVRETLFQQFRDGAIRVLALSRVANMAVDLPSASVAVQLSGLYGSRQEEAQRLGRLLRPKSGTATFYSLVSAGTCEEDVAQHRGLYLAEQGYTFEVVEVETLIDGLEKG